MNLTDLEESTIDDRLKGVPPGTEPFRLGEIGRFGWNVLAEDLPLPLAVLRTDALDHNSRWMQRFLAETGTQLYPHGKTTMSPQLFARQLADGARGITLSTAHHVAVARRYGLKRILIANQTIGRIAADYLARELRRDSEFELLCVVDSPASADVLADAARRNELQRPIDVLLEVGITGGRCGVRDLPAAMTLARQIAQSAPHLRLRGSEGFEGIISGATPEETETRIRTFLSFLCEVAVRCCEEQLLDESTMLLSAGGSAYFDLVAEGFERFGFRRRPEVILRSGCYLTHDSESYIRLHERMRKRSNVVDRLGEGLRPALEIWAYVQSRPEPTRAVLTMGRRDCSFDSGLPVPAHWFRPGKHHAPQSLPAGHRIASLNDQHAMLDLPADSPLQVGDMVASGISHPCTTFDKWQLIPLVDASYNVTGAIRTFF